ncbi:hypothetical protein INR49_012239, partial [Caranx melampygus]
MPQLLDSAFWLPKPHSYWDNDRKADRNHFLESENTLDMTLNSTEVLKFSVIYVCEIEQAEGNVGWSCLDCCPGNESESLRLTNYSHHSILSKTLFPRTPGNMGVHSCALGRRRPSADRPETNKTNRGPSNNSSSLSLRPSEGDEAMGSPSAAQSLSTTPLRQAELPTVHA